MSLSLLSPVRQMAARICRNPFLSLLIVLPLAIGIASTSTMYCLIHDVLMKPLPFPNADRLVSIWFTPPNNSADKEGANAGGYFELAAQNRSFSAVGAIHQGVSSMTFSAGPNSTAPPERLHAALITATVLPLLSVPPEIGRWFRPSDMRAGPGNLVLLSDRVWRRQLGADPSVLGHNVLLDDIPATVVGVMPPAFNLFGDDLWLPQQTEALQAASRSPNRFLRVIARLKPGASLATAQADMNLVAHALDRDFPKSSKGWGINLEPLHATYVGKFQASLLLLQAAAIGLLLIACANAGGVLFAQTLARSEELALRAALGATRRRLLGQLVAEGAMFSCVASLLGLIFTWASLRLLSGISTWIPPRYETGLDANVIGVSVLISLVAGVAASTIPALLQSRANLATVMRRSGRTASRLGSRFQNGFVIAQIAISVVLLCASGVMIRSLLELKGADLGLDPTNVLSFQLQWPRTRSFIQRVATTPNRGYEVKVALSIGITTEALVRRIERVKGIDAAAASVYPPLSGESRLVPMTVQGRPLRGPDSDAVATEWYPVSPQFFAVTHMRLKSGRTFSAEDGRSDAAPVVIINEPAARRLFGGANPIGHRIRLGILNDKARRVVGVVSYVRQSQFASDAEPQVYVPRAQIPLLVDGTTGYEMLTSTFVVRTRLPQTQISASMRKAVADIAPGQAISNMRSLSDYASVRLAHTVPADVPVS